MSRDDTLLKERGYPSVAEQERISAEILANEDGAPEPIPPVVEWNSEWEDTELSVPLGAIYTLLDELVELHGQGAFHFSQDLYRNLVLRAKHLGNGREEKHAKCIVCSKSFPTLRASAKYCSRACEGRAQRRKRVANSATHTAGTPGRKRRT